MAFHVIMIFARHRLLVYSPVRDVLDYVGIASSRVHPSMLRTLLNCVVTWQRMLELTNEEYPNLIAREFIFAQ